ncbi:MAG: acyltransferase family protein [Bacilli bacterium]|nr:acyltransferase family protein [Bacilli bacterium]
MKNKRLIYFDILKIVCTFLVIFNHSHWYIVDNNRYVTLFHLGFFNICKIAVPIFLMITGSLMLNREVTYAEILKKRIPRVYMGLLISTIFGCFFYKLDFGKTILMSFFGGQTSRLYWLWYIYLLVSLYLLTPFIKSFIRNYKDKDFENFIILFIFLPSSIYFVSNFYELALCKYKMIDNIFYQLLYLTYIGYYVFGYYVSNKKISDAMKNKSIRFFLIFFVEGFIYLIIGYLNNYKVIELFNNSLPIAIMSCSFFIFIKYYFVNFNCSERISKFIILLSDSTFGIYLFHLYLIEFLFKRNIFIKLFSINSIVGTFSLMMIVYIVLTFLFYFLKKIPFLNKIF